MLKRLSGIALAIIGAFALGGIALHRHEPINALWILVASACIYTLGYRFYAAWITARVLSVDSARATPAERLNNGRDFVPTHRWVTFGHHFSAIAAGREKQDDHVLHATADHRADQNPQGAG